MALFFLVLFGPFLVPLLALILLVLLIVLFITLFTFPLFCERGVRCQRVSSPQDENAYQNAANRG